MYDSLRDKEVDDALLALEELEKPAMPDPWEHDTKESFVEACKQYEVDYFIYEKWRKLKGLNNMIDKLESLEDVIEAEIMEAEKEGVTDADV